jgi:zinc protease
MERRPEPMRDRFTEPLPEAERRLVWRSTELEPRVEARFLVPGVGHPDRPHFDVLAAAAAEEVRADLAHAGIAARTGAGFNVIHTGRFGVPATLNIEVVVTHEADLDRAEERLFAVLERMGRTAVPAERIDAVRKQLRTDWHRTARNADALAFEIGHFFTMDRWQTLEEHLNARERTSAADLQRLAARYFTPENRSVGIVRRPTAAAATEEAGR